MTMTIKTHINIINPVPPPVDPNVKKYLPIVLDRVLLNEEVKEQIINVLSNTMVIANGVEMNAYDASPLLSYNTDDFPIEEEMQFYTGEVLVTPCFASHGSKQIKMLISDESGGYHLFCTIKYFIDIEEVYKVASVLNQAVFSGYFPTR